jgi:hypothetical protein
MGMGSGDDHGITGHPRRSARMDLAGMDDDAMLAELRRVAAEADGPPEGLLSAARAAITARDLDAELAVLVGDSRMSGDLAYEPVRADAAQGVWLLSFEGGGVLVDMEVHDDGGPVRLVGQLSGASPDECYLEPAGGQRRRIEVDDLGRFLASDVPRGPVRLQCRSTDGTRVTTAWVTV